MMFVTCKVSGDVRLIPSMRQKVLFDLEYDGLVLKELLAKRIVREDDNQEISNKTRCHFRTLIFILPFFLSMRSWDCTCFRSKQTCQISHLTICTASSFICLHEYSSKPQIWVSIKRRTRNSKRKRLLLRQKCRKSFFVHVQ